MTARLVALLIAVLVLAGCSATLADETADGSGGELGATQWVLRSYLTAGALTIVPDGLYADAEFKSGRLFGFGGCNEYDAVYRAGGRTLPLRGRGQPAPGVHSAGMPTRLRRSAFR